ncbi:hypothetical protein P7C70_g2985, partial [Phenoliferia sp. Uapishka_3]
MSKHSTSHGPFIYKRVAGVQYKPSAHSAICGQFGLVAGLSRAIMRSASGKPSKGDEDHSLPLFVFFHGGGLVAGSRKQDAWFPHWLKNAALDAGFAFLSADYTLLGPHNGHTLVTDVKDLFTWIAADLNVLIAESTGTSQLLNINRIVVSGASAGGYLAYLAGLYATPKPKALAPIYSMCGDILSDFWVKPHTEPFAKLGGPLQPLFPSIAPFLPIIDRSPTAPPITETSVDPTKEVRIHYLSWLLQTGEFTDLLTGEKGLGAKLEKLEKEERGGALSAEARVLYPALVADKSFPPTFLLHGAEDSLILADESRNMAAILKGLGVEHELVIIPGVDHAFDMTPAFDLSMVKGLIPFLVKHSEST